ncbi:MAG: ATP-binding cassette domain-containing protein, partial [Raoultibacter sp.]
MTIFEARHLAVSYPREGASVPLFTDLSFALEEATIYDLVGSSGSGKSTLLRVCALLLERDGGELLLRGESAETMRPTVWRKHVCLVPQKPSLISGTVRDNLVLPWTLKVHAGETSPADAQLANLLAKAGLTDIELNRDISQLSGGQAARVALL